MIWAIFWAVVSGILALTTLYLISYLVRVKLSTLTSQEIEKLHQFRTTMGFWSLLGAIFGSVGAAGLMQVTATPVTESRWWIAFGVIGGFVWGALWGAFWQMTSR